MQRKLVPIKNSVVCKRITEKSTLNKDIILVRKNNVDIYEILDFSKDNDEEFTFSIGDKVMSNSVGDEIEINEDEIIYLFKTEHIMCKVED